MPPSRERCSWGQTPEIYVKYHDEEWGVPEHNDRRLFEMLCLEGAQAGLSWLTILKKRAHYQKVFDAFDPIKMSSYGSKKIATLLEDSGIVRNKLKVNAFVINAQKFLKVLEEFDSFDEYIWQFVDGQIMQNKWQTMGEVPVTTNESDAMSKDLKKRGFKFIGSTICYAYMQSMGMVNDHVITCFRHKELAG